MAEAIGNTGIEVLSNDKRALSLLVSFMSGWTTSRRTKAWPMERL